MRWRGGVGVLLGGGAVLYVTVLVSLHSVNDGGDGGAQPQHPAPESHQQHPPQADVAAEPTAPPRVDAPPRLYCMVPSLWSPKKQLRWEEIADTWGKRCDVLRFFIDADPDADRGIAPSTRYAVVQIKMTRHQDPACTSLKDKFKCRHIWEKMWRSWVWVSENEIGMADFFAKVDDDTYLFPDNAKRFVVNKGWSLNGSEPRYFGHKLEHKPFSFHGGVIAGAASFFSRAAITQLGAELKTMPSHRDAEAKGEGAEAVGAQCVDRAGAYEEVGTAACLLKLGIIPVHIQDDEGKERGFLFHAYNIRSMVRPADGERQGWYWEGKPRSMDGGDACCAPDPLYIHEFKRLGQLRDYEKMFYGADPVAADFEKSWCHEQVRGAERAVKCGKEVAWFRAVRAHVQNNANA